MLHVRLSRLLLLTLVLIWVLAACGFGAHASRPTIRVASKDFTEQFIIGEMYALLLEEAGYRVERRLNLGGTPVAHQALLNGDIDLYPEYTGTGLLTVLKRPTMTDRQQVYATVAAAYAEQFDLIWLEPAPMNNTQALAMTRDAAERYGIRTISDMVAKASELRLIGPPEFTEREDGLPGLKRVYGNFQLKQYIAVDPGLKYRGLTSGQADVAVAFGTDGQIDALDLVVLSDDKGLFPPYQVAPVVRRSTLEANPQIRDALDQLAPLLTDEAMRRLNYEVESHQKEPGLAARDFLTQIGLIKQ